MSAAGLHAGLGQPVGGVVSGGDAPAPAGMPRRSQIRSSPVQQSAPLTTSAARPAASKAPRRLPWLAGTQCTAHQTNECASRLQIDTLLAFLSSCFSPLLISLKTRRSSEFLGLAQFRSPKGEKFLKTSQKWKRASKFLSLFGATNDKFDSKFC